MKNADLNLLLTGTAKFNRKANSINRNDLRSKNAHTAYRVTKVITLPLDAYTNFTKNLIDDYDFITKNQDYMGFRDNCYHCLMITANEASTAVLAESEGYDYARYSALVAKN